MTSTDDLPEFDQFPELDTLAISTKEGHKVAVEMYNRFAKNQGTPILKDLDLKDVCGAILENGSMANPIPPIQKTFGQYAHWLLFFAKKNAFLTGVDKISPQ